MTTLYKLDTKGKVRVWEIETQGANLIQRSGLEDGKMVTNTKTCVSKNVGKSNETSPEAQAVMEMKSEIASKLDEGYFRTKKEALSTKVILPMLAKSYDDEKKKITWDDDLVYVQPKLDGMRCLAFIEDGEVELLSRDGKVIITLPHIIEALSKIKGKVILDGELYAHGKTFQENMKLIKKYRQGETEEIMYHVYDMVSDENFHDRYFNLAGKVANIKVCQLVRTHEIKSEEDLKSAHAKFLSEGYEGSIVRWGDAPYKPNGRSSNLLKFKDFIDLTAAIIDIEPAEQRPEWGVPVLEVDGKQFRAGMKYSHDERKEFLVNKKDYIGKTAEIRFFEYTDDGLPRFPVMVGIRLDK